MTLIPSWAPNVHPLIIHFPVVLLIVAVLVDLAHTMLARPTWLGAVTMSLYITGTAAAIAAYATGLQAAANVLIPGMAHPLVDSHQDWALATTSVFGALTVARLLMIWSGASRSRLLRVALLVAGLIGAVLLQQTAERGARLVYEQGVGVIKHGI